MIKAKAFQEYYPSELSHCYGCGTENPNGLQLKSYWDGEESIAHYIPKDYHIAVPGFVYGGLLASLIDCHGTGTAAASIYKKENREMSTNPPVRFMTAQLNVKYLRPTPLGVELELRGKITESKGARVTIIIQVFAKGKLVVKGEVIASRVPNKLWKQIMEKQSE